MSNKLKCLFEHHKWQTGYWLRRCVYCNYVEIVNIAGECGWIPLTKEYHNLFNTLSNVSKISSKETHYKKLRLVDVKIVEFIKEK